jgi:hypothetical protein
LDEAERCTHTSRPEAKRKYADFHTGDELDDIDQQEESAARKRPRTASVSAGFRGRSRSAPPPPNVSSSSSVTISSSVHIADSVDSESLEKALKEKGEICFPFFRIFIDEENSEMQLLSYKFSMANNCPFARKHLKACARFMFENHKVTDATEAFGEICAAMYVLENYKGYEMIWGFHKHKGAGIDQIWKHAKEKKYLIVEAKGFGIELSKRDESGGVIDGRQMSLEWVGDRLFRMKKSWDNFPEIERNLGLDACKVGDGLVSKMYYTVKQLNPTWTLSGIAVQGDWKANCEPYGNLIMDEKRYVFPREFLIRYPTVRRVEYPIIWQKEPIDKS